MGTAQFDVIAKDLVVADLQVRDVCFLGNLGLVLSDPLLPANCQLAEFIQLGVKAVANETAIATRQRAFVDQCQLDLAADVGAEIQFDFQHLQQHALACSQLGLDLGQAGQRTADEAQVARTASTGRHTGQQSFDVIDVSQLVAQVASQDSVGNQLFDRVEPLVDRIATGQRARHPLGQHSRAHGRDRSIENG